MSLILLSDLRHSVEHVPLNAIQETHRTVDLGKVLFLAADSSSSNPNVVVCLLLFIKLKNCLQIAT